MQQVGHSTTVPDRVRHLHRVYCLHTGIPRITPGSFVTEKTGGRYAAVVRARRPPGPGGLDLYGSSPQTARGRADYRTETRRETNFLSALDVHDNRLTINRPHQPGCAMSSGAHRARRPSTCVPVGGRPSGQPRSALWQQPHVRSDAIARQRRADAHSDRTLRRGGAAVIPRRADSRECP
jgi:hypothetical protein